MSKAFVFALSVIALAILGTQIASLASENSSNLTLDPPKTVPYVDLSKYIGLWYEQAVIPFYFERNC